jgi:hypothetical protein
MSWEEGVRLARLTTIGTGGPATAYAEPRTLAELEEAAPRTEGRYLFEKSLGLSETARDPVFAYLADSPVPYAEKLAWLRQHFRSLLSVPLLVKEEYYGSIAQAHPGV